MDTNPLAELLQSMGRVIRLHRKERQLSLHEMSERSGVSLGYLSQIELAKNQPSLVTIHRICTVLGITLVQLLTRVEHEMVGRAKTLGLEAKVLGHEETAA